MKDLQKILLSSETLIRKGIEVLNTTALQIIIVVDENKKLLGTVTDGDIRRGILRGIPVEAPLSKIMNSEPKTATRTMPREELLELMTKYSVRHVPVLDKVGRVTSVHALNDFLKAQERENTVVLMAGGLGKRMRPMTDSRPKPLLTVGKKPVLEIIMEQFIKAGFKQFIISVNYKAEMIMDHFGDGSKWEAQIQYVNENEPLGTAGALNLLKQKPSKPFFVMNADVLTKANFTQLMDFHEDEQAVMTMAVREYDFQVPFGVVKIDQNKIQGIDEKPIHRFFVNAGIYILNPEALDYLPQNRASDMPELLERILKENQKTAAFPITEYWLDVGQKADFDRANGDFTGEFGDLR